MVDNNKPRGAPEDIRLRVEPDARRRRRVFTTRLESRRRRDVPSKAGGRLVPQDSTRRNYAEADGKAGVRHFSPAGKGGRVITSPGHGDQLHGRRSRLKDIYVTAEDALLVPGSGRRTCVAEGG